MRPLFLTWLYMDYACAKHVQLLIKTKHVNIEKSATGENYFVD